MKILVTGSIAYDILLSHDGAFRDAFDGDIDQLSAAFVTPHLRKHHGGTGANIAWNLRLLHRDPLLVGAVGIDGGEYLALLEERGIATFRIVRNEKLSTATAIVATDRNEHQITFYHPGADGHASWPDLLDDREDIALAIVSPRDASVMVQACDWCREAKVPYVFDPGQQVLAIAEGDLRRCLGSATALIANAFEWSLLADRLGLSTDDVLAQCPTLIVTHGEHGLTVYTGEGTSVITACKAEKIVNPTGAGDGLRAGILAGLSAKWSILDAARLGASLASFVVEQEGTLLDFVDVNDVWGRAEIAYGEVLPELV